MKKLLLATEAHRGLRLDAALAELLPGAGLRGRRRHFSSGLVTLNNLPAKPSMRLNPGDILQLHIAEKAYSGEPAKILCLRHPWCFFYKPRGLHTAAISGSPAPSLESMLPRLLKKSGIEELPRLLQRLDFATSGIVAASFDADAGAEFKKMEGMGRCRKYYLAVLSGILREPVIAGHALDTRNRGKTRILAEHGGRETRFFPLASWQNFAGLKALFPADFSMPGGATLALCEIASGQRHQIRCHSAAIGFPLAGDGLYGMGRRDAFILEHFLLQSPDFEISFTGAGSLAEKLPQKGKDALAGWLERKKRVLNL